MASSSKGKETLESHCAALKIHDTDEVEIQVGDDVFNPAVSEEVFTLVGTVLTEKTIKFNFIKETLATIWRPGRGMVAKEISPNLFVFYFFHAKDVKRVLEDGPWSYDQNLLILQRLGRNESPFEATLDRADFWIQIHKIPQPLTNVKMAELIGASLGRFIKADVSHFDGTWNAFIRIRVSIEIHKPLKKMVRIILSNGESLNLECKYERLPTYCFICGLIGHAEKYCPQQFDIDDDSFVKPFGPELRATGRRPPVQCDRWLLPQFPSRFSTLSDEITGAQTEVEDGTCSTRYEVRIGQTDDVPFDTTVNTHQAVRDQSFRPEAFNDMAEGFNVLEDTPLPTIQAHSSVLDIQMTDQTRKRAAHELDGPGHCPTAQVVTMSIDPKNVPEAGPGVQARLEK